MSLSRQSLALVLTTNKSQTRKNKYSDLSTYYLPELNTHKKTQKNSEVPSL